MLRASIFYIWLTVITVASLLPSSSIDMGLSLPLGADKGIHSLMYMALVWIGQPVLHRPHYNYRRILVITAGIILYGMLLEVLQPLVAARTFEWADILANTAGVLGGLLLWQRQPQPLRIESTTEQAEHTE